MKTPGFKKPAVALLLALGAAGCPNKDLVVGLPACDDDTNCIPDDTDTDDTDDTDQ